MNDKSTQSKKSQPSSKTAAPQAAVVDSPPAGSPPKGPSSFDERPSEGQQQSEETTPKQAVDDHAAVGPDSKDAPSGASREHPSHDSCDDSTDDSGPDSGDNSRDDSAEVAQLKDQLLRAMAETENLRRRSARELEDRLKYACGALARDLLPVADNLNRALSSLDAEARAADERLAQLATGLEAISRDLLDAFQKNDIRRLDPLGQPFNPVEHEAMLKIQDDSRPPGTVVQVMQAGYILRDRLLRPAMVGVAEGGEPPGHIDEKA